MNERGRSRTRIALSALLVLAGCATGTARSEYATAPHAPPAAQLSEMVALYDRVCLHAFPDDDALTREMVARHATAMSPAQVAIYLHDDPGTGWTVNGRSGVYRVTLEAPPFHACGVRTMTRAGFPDLGPYRRLVSAYEAAHGSFSAVPAINGVAKGVRTSLAGESAMSDGGARGEAMLIAVGTPVEAHARARGDTAIEVRFVHQLMIRPDRTT